jgi:hypothetical protein
VPIGDRVSLTSFAVSLPDRVAGKGGSTATLVFAPSVGGEISVGGNITLSYPTAFFQLEPTPSLCCYSHSSLPMQSQENLIHRQQLLFEPALVELFLLAEE